MTETISHSFLSPTQMLDLSACGVGLSLSHQKVTEFKVADSCNTMDKQFDQIDLDYSVEKVESNFVVTDYIKEKIEKHQMEDPFYVVDLGVVKRKLLQWRELLPRVEPFYAMKCNPHPAIIKTLKSFGIGFDCASKVEIQTIVESEGVSASNVIFANPCKPPSHLLYAKEKGVEMMTFDNIAELEKIHKHYPTAKVILRLLTDDSSSICRFGSKFGAPPQHVPILMKKTLELGLDLIGLSFHVGSGCLSADAFVEAVRYAHSVYCMAQEMGINMTLLDIGGGFPGCFDTHPYPSFQDIASVLAPALDDLFPADLGVRLIAEPGRYFAAESHTLAVCVYARRDVELEAQELGLVKSVASESLPEDESMEKPDYLYYVNDGVYGSFNCIFFDHAKVEPLPLKSKGDDKLWRSTIFGPTCDSLDCISKNAMLPKLDVGDWIYFKEMGAYTVAAASRFNGFDHPSVFFVDSIGRINPG
jgi:ornithine decarboxylase